MSAFRVEALEPRRLLAQHNEDFTDDFNPATFGYDSFDTDPATVVPDEIQIPHDVTTRVSFNRNRYGNPTDFLTVGPSPDHYLVNFASTRGQPGGVPADAEVVAVGFRYSGSGTATVVGDNGRKTLTLASFGSFAGIAVTSNDPSDTTGEVGAIQFAQFVGGADNLHLDDVSVLVLDAGFSNNPPSANADNVTTLPGQPVVIDFLANDGDLDGDPIRFESLAPPPAFEGQVTLAVDPVRNRQVATFTPAAGFHGVSTFQYVITDDRGSPIAHSTGTIRVLVNTPPVAQHKNYHPPHNSFGPFTGEGLLSSKLDDDGDVLTARVAANPSRGSVVIHGDGSFTYTPGGASGRVLDDSFQFVVSDGLEDSEPKTVDLDVPNVPPSAAGGSIDVAHGAATPLLWSFPVTDADGDTVTVELVAQAVNGQVRDLSVTDGRIHVDYWTESRRAITSDRFTYRLFDGYDLTQPVVVDIRVPNQRPEVAVPAGRESLTYHAKALQLTPTGMQPVEGVLFKHEPGIFQAVARTHTETTDPFCDAPDDAEEGCEVLVGVDQEGDPLRPVLAVAPRRGTVTFTAVVEPSDTADRPTYHYLYTPGPPFYKVTANGLAGVVQEMYDTFPARVPAIREAAGRLGALDGAEYPNVDAFLADAEAVLLDAPFVVALTEQEVLAFRSKLPIAARLERFFGSDRFSYRLSDGALETADVVNVIIPQLLGTPVASSDAFSFEGSVGGPHPDDHLYDQWLPIQLDAAGIGSFTPGTLLLNDELGNGFPASFFPELDLRVKIERGLVTGFAMNEILGDAGVIYHLYDGVGHLLVGSEVVRAGDALYVVNEWHGNLNDLPGRECALEEFQYSFTYQHPLLGTVTSSTATVLVQATKQEHADRDGVPDDVEDDVPSRSDVAGDGNGDGIPDSEQSWVASLPAANGGPYVTLVSEPGLSLVGVSAAPTPPNTPPGLEFPLHFFRFSVVGLPPGGRAAVTILLPPGVHVDAYYKFNDEYDNVRLDDYSWYRPDIPAGTEFKDDNQDGFTDRIIIHLQDRQYGDQASNAQFPDGLIIDPGGLAILRPLASTDVYVTDEDHPLAVAAAGVLGNDVRPGGRAISAELVTAPRHGRLSLDRAGSFLYTPDPDYNGTDTFTYRAADAYGASAPAAVTITVNPVEDVPMFVVTPLLRTHRTAVTVLLPGSERLRAEEVDVKSLRLLGLRPQRVRVGRFDGDDRDDLLLQFTVGAADLRALYKRLLAEADQVIDGRLDVRARAFRRATLTLEGATVSGQKFAGRGTVAVLLAGSALRDVLDELLREQLI